MIKCEGKVAQYEGEPKDICKELTLLIMGFVDTLEKEFDLSREQSVYIVAECANIAVMDPEQRAEYMEKYDDWKELLN